MSRVTRDAGRARDTWHRRQRRDTRQVRASSGQTEVQITETKAQKQGWRELVEEEQLVGVSSAGEEARLAAPAPSGLGERSRLR